jgi:hypothetical protein
MPVAEVASEGTREELKSLEGAYVVIKPLPYGERLAMRDRASRMSMESDNNSRRRRDATTKIDIDTMMAQSRAYEFAHCIIDHNLELKNGTKMDFKSPDTLSVLDPRVGAEIEELIDKHNEVESEEELANLNSQLTSSMQGQRNSDLKEDKPIPTR